MRGLDIAEKLPIMIEIAFVLTRKRARFIFSPSSRTYKFEFTFLFFLSSLCRVFISRGEGEGRGRARYAARLRYVNHEIYASLEIDGFSPRYRKDAPGKISRKFRQSIYAIHQFLFFLFHLLFLFLRQSFKNHDYR